MCTGYPQKEMRVSESFFLLKKQQTQKDKTGWIRLEAVGRKKHGALRLFGCNTLCEFGDKLFNPIKCSTTLQRTTTYLIEIDRQTNDVCW